MVMVGYSGDRLWYEIFAGIADAGSSMIRGCLLGQSRHRPHSSLARRGTAIGTDPPLVSHLPYYKIIGGLWKNYNLVNIYLHFESFKFDFIILLYIFIICIKNNYLGILFMNKTNYFDL